MADEYWVNTGFYQKFKKRFNLRKFKTQKELHSVTLSERVVEIPFALGVLSSTGGIKRVLDFGCSASLMPQYLTSLGYEVTGLDLRHYPYTFPHFNFIQADIFKTDFKDEMFDAVVCISTLEHVGLGFYGDEEKGESLDIKAVKEVKRILKKGGCFILTVPFGVYFSNEHQRIYDYPRLQKILNEFKINKIEFFASFSSSGKSNYWKKISQQEAGAIEFNKWVSCVCCMSLEK